MNRTTPGKAEEIDGMGRKLKKEREGKSKNGGCKLKIEVLSVTVSRR